MSKHDAATTLETALDQLYRGEENAVKLAMSVGLSKTEFQQVFQSFVASRPIDPDVWQKDVELSWPFIT